MMNKKLAALLVAFLTVNASVFGDGFLGDIGRGLGRTTESVVSAPADLTSGGRTWEERHERWAESDADRHEREEERRERARERRERREDRYND